MRWLQQNEHYVREKLGLTVEGKAMPLPRYYRKKLGIKAEAYDDLYKKGYEKITTTMKRIAWKDKLLQSTKRLGENKVRKSYVPFDELRGGKGKLYL